MKKRFWEERFDDERVQTPMRMICGLCKRSRTGTLTETRKWLHAHQAEKHPEFKPRLLSPQERARAAKAAKQTKKP